MAAASGIKNFRAKVLASFVAVFLMSWLSILVATYFNLQDLRQTEQEEIRLHFQQLYQRELTNYHNSLAAALDILTHPSRVAYSFTQSNKPFFLSNFAADFANLNQRMSVSHLYFDTADRQNIARLPTTPQVPPFINRYTTTAATQGNRTVSGVELNDHGEPIFSIVKPLFAQQELRGFVELGRKLNDIWPLAGQQLDVSVLVLVHKSQLDQSRLHNRNDLFANGSNWSTYKDYVAVASSQRGGTLPEVLRAIVEQQHLPTAGEVAHEKQVFLYTSLPLEDVVNNQVGTILLSYPQQRLTGNLIKDLGAAASASALALLIGLTICYLLLSPVARSLQNSQAELVKEIAVRTHDLFAAKEEAIKAKDAAEIANKAKSEFLSNMSHELRTPLNAIIGFSSIVKNDELSEGIGEKYKSYLNDIHGSGTHLLNIINDILDVSRIEAGEMEMRFQHVSVNTLLHECHQMVNVRATDRSIPVIHDKFENDVEIEADQTRLKQIILNLLSNAIKFTKPPGTVRFHAEVLPENQIRFVIEDEGVGIPKGEQPTVLRRFGKAASSVLAKNHHEGTGLGLTLVQDLIKKHGGTFTFQSTPGKGTRASFILPVQQPECDDFGII